MTTITQTYDPAEVEQLRQRVAQLDGEVERYRSGMANWKATAEEKDRQFAAQLAQQDGAQPEMWQHVKTGGTYEWLMSAVNEEDQSVLVVYRSAETGVRWVRPSKDFYDGRFIRVSNTHPSPQTATDAQPTPAVVVKAALEAAKNVLYPHEQASSARICALDHSAIIQAAREGKK